MKIPTNKVTAAGLLIALGIIYGEIGTSPLYVFNAIINNRVVNEDLMHRIVVLYHLDADFTNDY
ncbi:MAG: KUP/HAK/KT family potassium transporter [Chitinophagaceae bacterium]